VCGSTYPPSGNFCPNDGTPLLREPRADLVGSIVAGRYRVERALGAGGMGHVYLAEDLRVKRPCALKVLRDTLAADADAVLRLAREAHNAGRISHSNVATTHDFGQTPDGRAYLVTEFVDGRTLTELLAGEAGGALRPRRVARLVWQIA